MARWDRGKNADMQELSQLKGAVRVLQRQSKEQMALERETHSMLENLHEQMGALKSAFKTLSEVMVEELEELRNEAESNYARLESKIDENQLSSQKVERELQVLVHQSEALHSKERDWFKDSEILKVQGQRVAGWITQLQRDIMETKDCVSALRAEHSSRSLQITEEANSLRHSWRNAADAMVEKVADLEGTVERLQNDSSQLSHARISDLELTERALSTLKQQQVRLRSSMEENLGVISSDVKAVEARTAAVEKVAQKSKSDIAELSRGLEEVSGRLRNRLKVIDQLLSK